MMTLLKDNFYVFTGGPGAGKSSLLEALGAKGFSHVQETGRALIRERLQKGLTPRPAAADFAGEMFAKDLLNFTSRIGFDGVLFFDRSFLDSAALLHAADMRSFQKIMHVLATHRFNPTVFIAPPWRDIYENDNERDQSFEESERVYERMYSWYKSNDYNLVTLPCVSVPIRAEFVLKELALEPGR